MLDQMRRMKETMEVNQEKLLSEIQQMKIAAKQTDERLGELNRSVKLNRLINSATCSDEDRGVMHRWAAQYENQSQSRRSGSGSAMAKLLIAILRKSPAEIADEDLVVHFKVWELDPDVLDVISRPSFSYDSSLTRYQNIKRFKRQGSQELLSIMKNSNSNDVLIYTHLNGYKGVADVMLVVLGNDKELQINASDVSSSTASASASTVPVVEHIMNTKVLCMDDMQFNGVQGLGNKVMDFAELNDYINASHGKLRLMAKITYK